MEEDIKTNKLMDEERKQRIAQAQRISDVTLEVEAVLLKHNLTWSEWGDVINTMNKRTSTVFDEIKVSEIKERYDRPIK